MTMQFVRPTEVVTRTGRARDLLTPNSPGDEGYNQPVLFQLPAEADGRSVQRSRSVLVEKCVIVSPDRPRDDERIEVFFVDRSVPSVFVGYDEEVTVHLVKVQVS
ncbi:hypothetical protein GV792_04750 [Nocardia cyriacigeorgica]|uniref:hypothetical protein n=1 Tax=Nocardia cyriacigeorgica TaxID=135487 RepID=UPI0013B7A780|nr:hypothetical protein [Nocardia cyriacigeorgica]NEW49352.1 hypothetical protein [Nocardia cyriacigeorgica]